MCKRLALFVRVVARFTEAVKLASIGVRRK
jgi:hypothetical protein